MSSKRSFDDLPDLNIAEYLDTPEVIHHYLEDILRDNDADLLAAALGHIAKAKGMKQVADAAGLKRESMYKALRAGASPRFSTIKSVLDALGFELKIERKLKLRTDWTNLDDSLVAANDDIYPVTAVKRHIPSKVVEQPRWA